METPPASDHSRRGSTASLDSVDIKPLSNVSTPPRAIADNFDTYYHPLTPHDDLYEPTLRLVALVFNIIKIPASRCTIHRYLERLQPSDHLIDLTGEILDALDDSFRPTWERQIDLLKRELLPELLALSALYIAFTILEDYPPPPRYWTHDISSGDFAVRHLSMTAITILMHFKDDRHPFTRRRGEETRSALPTAGMSQLPSLPSHCSTTWANGAVTPQTSPEIMPLDFCGDRFADSHHVF